MWTITCGICKHEAAAELFFTGRHDQYACPHCGVVWSIQHQGKAIVTESGFVIPPRKVCVVEPQMMLVAR